MTPTQKKKAVVSAVDGRLKRLRVGEIDPDVVPNVHAAEAKQAAEPSEGAVSQPQLEESELSGVSGAAGESGFSADALVGDYSGEPYYSDGLEAAAGQLGVYNMYDMAGTEAGPDVIPASAEMLAAGAVLSPGTFGAAGAGLLGSTGLAAGGAAGLSATTLGAVGAGVAAAAAGVAVAMGGGGNSSNSLGLGNSLGSVTDGRISGAHLYVDVNDNGKYDAGTDTDTGVETSADGTFALGTTYAHGLLAVGGTNVDTGLVNKLTLSTAAGSTTINPITTLIDAYARTKHVSATDAETAVKAALGLSGVSASLMTYDPLALASSNPTDATALAVQKAAVALATAATNAQNAGAPGTTYGVEFFEAVASTIASGTISASAPLDLSSNTTLTAIDTAMSGHLASAITAIIKDVDAVMAATTLAQTGSGSLTLAQKGALDGTIETYTSLAAALGALGADPEALAAGAFNLEMDATDLQAAFGSNPEVIANALNILVTGTCNASTAAIIEGYTHVGATSLTISDSLANLVDADGHVASFVKGAVNLVLSDTVDMTDATTLAHLALLEAATTGDISVSAISGTAAQLLPGGVALRYIGSGTAVTVSGAATIQQLTNLDAANGSGGVTFTEISDTAANLAADAHHFISGSVNVTVLGAATAANIVAIDGWTDGTLTYTAITDTAHNIIMADGASHIIATTDVILVGASDVGELAQIAARPHNSLNYGTISGSLALLQAACTTNAALITGHDLLITESAKISELAAFSAYTDGTISGSLITDTAANLMLDLANAHTFITGAVNVTVSEPVVTPGTLTGATIAQLAAIDSHTTGTLMYTNVKDSITNLLADHGAGNYANAHATFVTGSATIEQLTTLQTNGATVTATLITDTAEHLAADAGHFSHSVLTNVQSVVVGAASIAQLTTISTNSGVGNYTYTSITDHAAALAANAGGFITSATPVTVDDTASLIELAAIRSHSPSELHYTDITGTAADLLANVDGFITGAQNLHITGVLSLQQLADLDGMTGGTLHYTQMTGLAADLAASSYVSGSVAVTITDAPTIDQLKALEGHTSGTLGYTAITDTAEHLAADAALAGGTGHFITSSTAVTITGAATIAQLAAIDGIVTGLPTYTTITDATENLFLGGAVNTTYVHPGVNINLTTDATAAQVFQLQQADAGGTVTPLDHTAPELASADLTGNTLVLHYTELNHLDAANAPGVGSYSVLVNGNPVVVSAVSVNATDNTVTLTLLTPVAAGVPVTVSYTDPTTGNDLANALQDTTGNDAAGFTNHSVTVVADNTAPVLQTAVVNGHTLTLTYDEALDTTVTESALKSAFTIDRFGDAITIASATISGDHVTLTLEGDVHSTQEFTVNYSGANVVQDAAGNDVATLTGQSVTNNTPDDAAPVLAAAAMVDAHNLVLAYTEPLLGTSTPAATDFKVYANGTALTVHSVAVAGNSVTVNVDETVATGAVVTVSYDSSSATPIKDASVGGNQAEALDHYVAMNASYNPAVANVSTEPGDATVYVDLIGTPVAANLSASDFIVKVSHDGGATYSPVTLGGMSVTASSVHLTLPSALAEGDVLSVQYTGTYLQDASSGSGFTYVDVVSRGEGILHITSMAQMDAFADKFSTLDHADSLWVDFDSAAGGLDLHTMDYSMGGGGTLGLGHNGQMGVGAAGTLGYTGDLGLGTFSTVALLGTGDHNITLNNAVNTVVVDDSQNGGSTLNLANVSGGHTLAVDFSSGVNLTTSVASAGLVTGVGQYNVDHDTTANTVTVTYYNATQTGNEVETLTLTHVSDTATIGVNGHGDLTIVNTGGVPGDASDGRLAGAHIYEDTNNNGVYDAGGDADTGVVTAADGSFTLPSTPTHAIFAVGGTNVDTGLANTMVMTAPVGCTNLNPITTLIASYVATQGGTAAAAEVAVKAALGLSSVSESLLTYDPLAVAATNPTDATALAVQKVAVSLAIATAAAESGTTGQGDNFLEAVAKTIKDGWYTATNTLDLNVVGDVQHVSDAMVSAGGTALSTTAISEIAGDVGSVMVATTLAGGAGSLSGVQQSVMGAIPTLTVATAVGHAAGTYNLVDSVTNILGATTLTNNAVNVTVQELATVGQATSLLALTNTGTTYYEVSGAYAALAPGDVASAVVAGAGLILVEDTVNMAQLLVLNNATTSPVNALHITDTAAHLLALGGTCPYICDGTVVTFTGPVSVAQLDALTPDYNGNIVVYTSVVDTLNALHTDIVTGKVFPSGTTHFSKGHAVTISDEVTLATGAVPNATAVGQLADLSDASTGASSVVFANKVWATANQALTLPALIHGVMPVLEITDEVSLSQLATIDSHVTGIINAVCITGTADELLALGDSPYFHSGMELALTGTYTAGQLAQLQNLGGITVDHTSATEVLSSASGPHLVSASVDPTDGHKLILVFDETVSGSPVPGDFVVGKDGEATAVATGGVAVSGTTVTLTLTDEIHYGQSVTLTVATPHLADGDSNAVGAISDHPVWNLMPETQAPQFVQAVVTGANTIVLGYDEGLAQNASVTGYSVHVVHADNSVDDYTGLTGVVANNGDHMVTLTATGASILATDTVTVTYTGTGVTDTATTPNTSMALTAAAVVNSSTIHVADVSADAPGNGLIHVDFGVALDTSAAVLASDFDVTVVHADGTAGTAALALSTMSSSGHSVTLQLDHDLLTGDVVTVEYTGSSIHAADGTLASHFTSVDVVGTSEQGLQVATNASFTHLVSTQEHLSHSDSLWVDFTDGTLTNGQHDLGTLYDLGAHQTLALGDSIGMDPSVLADGTAAYHVDMGQATFTTLSLFGSGDHTVVLNNAVDTVVVNGAQDGGSTLDLTNVLDSHHLTIDFSHAVSLGTSVAAAAVDTAGEYNVTVDATAHTADITYYNGASTAVLHLTGLHGVMDVSTDGSKDITIC